MPADAIEQLRAAVVAEPENARARNELGRALARTGRVREAVDAFREAVRLAPSSASFIANLGLAYDDSGQTASAVEQYRACLEIDPENLPVMNALARRLATSPDDTVRDGAEAVRLAERLNGLVGGRAETLDTLAAAYAESGQFENAAETARRALTAAARAGDDALADKLGPRVRMYENGERLRER